MTAPVTVEFDLPADEIPVLLRLKNARLHAGLSVVFMLALGALLIALGSETQRPTSVGGGLFFLVMGVFAAVVAYKGPSVGESHVKRLAGPTKVEFSDEGVHYAGSAVTERFEWRQLLFLNDRREAWVLNLRPSGLYVVPKSAMDPAQQEVFVRQLMEWAGCKYRPRSR